MFPDLSTVFPLSVAVQIGMALKLTLAVALSLVIGFNRERTDKPAGLRTHMLTGLGACLFTMLSVHAFPNADSARVAANVITGIGFLGGGIILHRRLQARGLTTAVGIWVTAAIGMAVGVGAWLLATFATVLTWSVLALFERLKDEMHEEPTHHDSGDDSAT